MTLQNATQQLVTRLSAIYGASEATTIADRVMEKLTGWNKMDRMINKSALLSALQKQQFEKYSNELAQHRPVQYVLGEAWFYGTQLYVNESVLIPRPETEELVEWILEQETGVRSQKSEADSSPSGIQYSQFTILDIGTGSGCIPIALKRRWPQAEVVACDISEAALQVARRNAQTNQAVVEFIQCDVLKREDWSKLPEAGIIVSNPPYIPLHDKATMQENVLGYEPHLALFVPDEDALHFYNAIAELAIVKKAKVLYFEIHEEQGDAIIQLLKAKGFTTIELRKDMQGKDRMIKASLNV